MSDPTSIDEPKFSSTWKCVPCNTEWMEKPDLRLHLKDKHGLELKGLKGTQRGISFLDGENFYSNTFEVIVECECGRLELLNNRSGTTK